MIGIPNKFRHFLYAFVCCFGLTNACGLEQQSLNRLAADDQCEPNDNGADDADDKDAGDDVATINSQDDEFLGYLSDLDNVLEKENSSSSTTEGEASSDEAEDKVKDKDGCQPDADSDGDSDSNDDSSSDADDGSDSSSDGSGSWLERIKAYCQENPTVCEEKKQDFLDRYGKLSGS